MNMKNILRLMGALALTTGAATSVVACGGDTPTPTIHMNAAVSKLLGLTTDDAGKTGTQVASLAINGTDVRWTIAALTTAITADKLLTNDNKAANQEAYDFITTTLKINATSGTSFKDAVFNKSELTAIKGEITNIKPTLTQLDNKKDYAITAGTFNFQFKTTNSKENDGKLGDNYIVNLKTDAAAGIIAATLATIANALVARDTDVETAISFAKGQTIPNDVDGTTIKITGTTTDAAKQFTALNKLTNLEITVQVKSHTGNTEWAENDTVTLSYQTTAVTFDKTSVFKIEV